MPFLIDRRLNPKGKSLGNRQRFMRRARAQIKEAVNKSLQDRSIDGIGSREKISVPSKPIREPRWRHAPTGGHREFPLPGNKEFVPGDRIPKPQGGGEGRGKDASDQGEGEDDFTFALSRDEFLDFFFEDLELPDLVKRDLKEIQSFTPRRAGYSHSGTVTNLSVLRTMRNSIGRRRALRRPALAELEALRDEVEELENEPDLKAADRDRLEALRPVLADAERRSKFVPFIDPLDIRYNRFEKHPVPKSAAVMFCLMDVSGSMGQREKDLAKRFFVLLHLFLKRRYERIEVVFVRHTHEAKEVDEETFFYSTESGGTVVSTALVEMDKIIRERFPVQNWNIYGAQISDGDNFRNDTARCNDLLANKLLPLCQYYAYVEVSDPQEMQMFGDTGSGSELWRGYSELVESWSNFAIKRIAGPRDIYPVFRQLFARSEAAR